LSKLHGCSYFVAVAAYFSYAIYIDIIFFSALKLLTCGRKYWQYIFQDAESKSLYLRPFRISHTWLNLVFFFYFESTGNWCRYAIYMDINHTAVFFLDIFLCNSCSFSGFQTFSLPSQKIAQKLATLFFPSFLLFGNFDHIFIFIFFFFAEGEQTALSACLLL